MSLCFFIVYHSTCILLICFIVNRFIGSSFPSFFIGGFRPFSRSSRPFFTAMISVALIRSFAYAALWIFLGILLHTRGPKNRLSVGPNSLAHAIDRFLCFQFLIFYLFFYFVFLSFLSLLSLLSPLSFDFSQKSWIIIVIMLLLLMMMIVIYCYFLHSCCCCCCCHFALFVVFFLHFHFHNETAYDEGKHFKKIPKNPTTHSASFTSSASCATSSFSAPWKELERDLCFS